MKTKKYLAIDLGASSGRGIVCSFDGEKLSLRENCRFANEPVKIGDRLYWDILRIFHEIKNSIRQTIFDNYEITSIGIDTWDCLTRMVDLFPTPCIIAMREIWASKNTPGKKFRLKRYMI